MENRNYESTGRVVLVAIAFFGGLALLGYASGVFDRLGRELTLLLTAFSVAFGALTWQLDPGVRAFVKRLAAPRSSVRKPRTQAAV